MDNYNYIIILYDYYGELFNEKQRKYFEDYYFNNLSLGEISDNIGISRNAIHKVIKNMEEKLIYYESKLQLYQKGKSLKEIISLVKDEKIKVKGVVIMKYVDKDVLPVEIKNNELPKDNDKKYQMFYNYKVRTSGGFADAIFLSAVMITCVMWGMLIILVAR